VRPDPLTAGEIWNSGTHEREKAGTALTADDADCADKGSTSRGVDNIRGIRVIRGQEETACFFLRLWRAARQQGLRMTDSPIGGLLLGGCATGAKVAIVSTLAQNRGSRKPRPPCLPPEGAIGMIAFQVERGKLYP